MRFHWLLPGFLSVFLSWAPAFAGQLTFWRFDPSQNRLDFKTDEGVQPKALLIANPTRLIIDLPSTRFPSPTVTKMVGGTVRSVRVGQFDENTTRLVIELEPGYTLDPDKVRFRGFSPTQWGVQLPTPQRVSQLAPGLPSSLSVSTPSSFPPQGVNPTQNQSSLQMPSVSVQPGILNPNLQVTRDGFFIRTSGDEAQLKVNRSEDRRTITIDVEGASLYGGNLSARDLPVNRYGVSRIQFSPNQNSRFSITLTVGENSPDWQPTFSKAGGGIVLLPQGTTAAKLEASSSVVASHEGAPVSIQVPTVPSYSPVQTAGVNQLAMIQAVELASSGNLLLIRSDQRVTPSSRWDGSTGVYRITIPSARLADRVRGPELSLNSPVSRVRLQQPDSRTVVILVEPAAGVQIGELNLVSDQIVALQLQRGARSQTPDDNSIRVPSPESNPSIELPRPRNGRVIVIVDPGHGGKDSGAPGRGGVLEKDIVLSIGLQVASLLEKQGIQAILTRNSDYFVDLQPRVDITNRARADLFVSIHANSVDGRPDVNGLETYYYESGERLAHTIHSSIVQSISIHDRGVRRARFYVLRKNSIPAVLVETGFVTSPEEASKLASPAYQNQMASAIARGILQYIQQNL